MSDAPPKSAVELAMEKLERQDADAGLEANPLTPAQTTAIADARRTYDAHVAEARILHESATQATIDQDARAELDANYRRDLSRFAGDRDKKINKIRKGDE